MAPKRKNSDAGNSYMQNRNCKVLPLSEKVYMYVYIKKNIDYIRSVLSSFRHPLGSWNKGGTAVYNFKFSFCS